MVTELSRYNLGVAFLRVRSRAHIDQFSDNWSISCGLRCLVFSVKFDL